MKADAKALGANEWFVLQYNNGVATIKTSNNQFISVAGDKVVLSSSLSDACTFEIILNMHPQVYFFSYLISNFNIPIFFKCLDLYFYSKSFYWY